jgi:hypothetical protein
MVLCGFNATLRSNQIATAVKESTMFWLTRLSFANRGIVALAGVTILVLGLFIVPLLQM